MSDVLLGREFINQLYSLLADYMTDWLIRTSTSYAYVTLPTNSRQVWGFPHKSGQNIKFFLIFLLVTSHFMFWTYQILKKWCG